jgi:hypothetical protein
MLYGRATEAVDHPAAPILVVPSVWVRSACVPASDGKTVQQRRGVRAASGDDVIAVLIVLIGDDARSVGAEVTKSVAIRGAFHAIDVHIVTG